MMKKVLFLLVSLLLSVTVNAQSGQSKVILKNGTELQGTIKSIDPTDAIKMVIAGVETSIKMSDVAKVEEVRNEDNIISPSNSTDNIEDKLKVTDFADYPESFDLKIGNNTIRMVLVRGGDMNMGFDGRHSRAMKSEPVHKVKVTSFYISEVFVPSAIVSFIKGKKYKREFYEASSWKDANGIVESIAKQTNKPVRLPTEAEWEYAASCQIQSQLFQKCSGVEYCSDFFDKFDSTEYATDPTGPLKGSYHVARAFNSKYGKYNRSWIVTASNDGACFRLLIKAKDL